MSKSEANKEVIEILEKAITLNDSKPEIAKKLIKKAQRIAMHSHIKIPDKYKNLFCKKCFIIFNSKNQKIRIKNKFRTITCLKCRYTKKYKLLN